MSFHINNLYFSPGNVYFWVGIIALVATIILCTLAIRRASRKWRTAGLESLRFLSVITIVLMLWKPEWRTVITPLNPPEIAILWDNSESMNTEDIALPAWLDPDTPFTTRAALAKKALDSSLWKTLASSSVKTFQQSFATPPENPTEEQRATIGTDLNTPILELAKSHDNLRAVVLLTDGTHNIHKRKGKPNSPTAAAQKLLLNKTPLFAVPVGAAKSLPDLDLTNLTAPDFGILGEFVQIPFTIESSMEREVRTTITLKDTATNNTKSKTITIPAGKKYHDSILWQLQSLGNATLEFNVPVAKGELNTKNNAQKFVINTKKESIKVLVIETLPRWEYRFIRNALSRDPGVSLSCLLLHPKLGAGNGPDYIQQFPEKLEELQKYDVIFLGDVGIGKGQLTKEQTSLLAGLVKEQASGIIFIPGAQGNQLTLKDSELGDLLPVTYDEKRPNGYRDALPSPLYLTKHGKGSLLTLLANSEEENATVWRTLPGFYWCAAIEKVKANATILATHSNRRNSYGAIPMLVTMQAGNGKTLYLGHDSAWRWRKGVEDLYHFRFWKNVARWMSYQRNMAAGERIRLYRTPDRPMPGDTVTINVNAFDKNGVPLREGKVYIDTTDPTGKTRRIFLEKNNDKWGAYSGNFTIEQSGEWNITAGVANSDTATVKSTILVPGQQLEKLGKPVDLKLLEEMARITGGKVIAPQDLQELADTINTLPEKAPLETRYPVWAHIALLITLIVLLCLFWTLRKLNGNF